ncbi:hypothetical protein FSP39_003301 [Pinctada imbricata]|uniref:Uncharacterized protein n=1 Tax=Pinctada imbricata TaxID=66713 RepID=A0AA88Y7C2_PINIB|nr:hypothetical protein FSP39_003301 [Pinctada imbricata]
MNLKKKLISDQGDKSELLSDECNFQLTQAASLVKGTLESLMDGSIMIEDLNIVLANEKGFISTTQIMSEKEKIEFKEDFVRKTIQLRDKELAKFREVKSLVDGLIDACQHIHVDTSDLEKSIRKLEKMDEMRVCDLCTPGALDKIQNLNDYEPTITYFRIGEEILSELPLFLRCFKGMVFMGIWGKTGERAVRNRDEPLSVEEMMEGVWQPAHEEWTNLGEKIRTGNITFREFYKHFKDYENSIIKRELRPFIVGDQNIVRWIDERLEQVDYQRVLEKCVDGARIILDVVETYDLQGDFSQIVLIEQMVWLSYDIIVAYNKSFMSAAAQKQHIGITHQTSFKLTGKLYWSMTSRAYAIALCPASSVHLSVRPLNISCRRRGNEMCDMNRSMIETCNLLRGMEIKQFNCLKEFISARPLVIWLRESMESLKELKVFVDLASISAGEGAMEVDKVKCLHAATTGYAPLIFNLGQECDCDRFLEKCKEVWRELASDPGLPKKLYDTHRELEWLKTVKKSHGSVEVTSMYQAEAINTVGIYRVGNITPGKQTTELTLNEVLELHVQEDEEGSRLRRKYDYKELHELQSKLMLVAGKAEQGKDDVDKFTLVLDSVVRLCNVYIKLVSAGCVLFTDWTARFLCDPDRKVCTFLRFAVDEGTQLKGRRSDTEDLGTIIPSLAKFMETCLEEWLKYIDEKREQYPLLNFFTIDQMVILQRELVKVGQDSEPSKLVYHLLCAVKRDCTKSDLITAMRQAKEDVEGKTMEVDVDDENVNEGNVEMDDEDGLTSDEVSKEAIFMEEMVKAGYSEGLAKKALQCTDADEIDQGIAWCMEHEDEVDMEVQSEVMDAGDMGGTSVYNEEVFEGWSTTGKSISSVTQDLLDSLKQDKREVQDENLVRDLQLLWNTFLSSISSSVDDYLSVEHLGLILQRLSQLESFQIERTFLPCFDVGVPNLLMCPQEEVLNTVISIYGHDNDQPLPQADEVLLCTPHTSLDELDIFMRRAIFNGGGRVHCLVNGDALDYEVSDKGERRLEKHMQNAKDQGIEYKLVVICCTEQEYRSRIVAALDKYRKPALPLMASEDIRNYILQKLAVENIVGSAKPAASVDFQKYLKSSVRVVKSWRAGVGKTLYKQRMAEKIETLMMSSRRQTGGVITIPLHEREINVNEIMRILLEQTLRAGSHEPRLFHIDIYHEVQVGVDAFLFQLLILGCLTDSSGYVWRKLPCDLYLIETMPLLARDNMTNGRIKCMHKCFDILPDVICRSPQESLDILNGRKPADYQESDLLFDEKEFRGAVFQRPYQYLLRLDRRQNLSDVAPDRPEGDKVSCLQILLRHCGIRDPSWSELKHFVRFLNSQLSNFETSAYCSLAAAEDLPGFAQFVLRFLIQMSRDFATRSLQISEESTFQTMQRMETDDDDENVDETLQGYQMRRTWESSPHPYLFFNPDGHSLTFLGFNINRQSGDLVDTQTGQVLERAIMQNTLQQALHRNRVNLSENFDGLPRGEKIGKLCSVMGTEFPHDPDETYELTTDNVKKILAIYMRFRCDIPVIIMGETGCGKTRLIKFMCSLQSPPGVEVQNMVLMKVHGGTTSADILRKVEEAERKAQENMEQYGRNMFTVLFFDEANTTEAIGIIKEIMCDHSMAGKPIRLCNNLKIVAACNPYRKHSEELIKRLEQAGLGYHVDADKTTDRLGLYFDKLELYDKDELNWRVPMRRLVYRVQPLPQSMLPLVWDFGQLDTRVEEMYIKQMVLRYIRNGRLPPGIETVVSKILTVSQDFMRKQEDECSFVSLRDVERVLEVMGWFYQQSDGPYRTILFDLMNQVDDSESEEEFDDEDEAFIDDDSQNLDVVTRSLILALGVCYHACLKNRQEYRMEVSQHFSPPCSLPGGEQQMLDEITDCQDIFLDNVQLEQKNIAPNQALKENLFMMVVCIELRIPLFLVGKPGSSKSLAKTIVTDAMQGNAAHKELFKYYKQVQMVSFQCSPLSVPEGIVGTFRQCAMYQKDKDLDRFVSVVVLDEVGLAEDSPRMPLKTLHPLLEDGCQGDETPEPYKKVAFIGISNWALDPAKMNRGILVQREVPDREDLKETAMGICSTERKIQKMIRPLIEPMADSYLELFNKVKSKREFFGLRDFYRWSMDLPAKYKKKPTWLMLKHSIMRNFGGFKDLDPVEVFQQKMTAVNKVEQPTVEDPDCSAAGLIQACLSGDSKESETRYLLLLTENYGALTVLQQKILTINNAITIFGSSFPSDQEYTQVCRNINRIKVCMETGSTVVLLNLENLYESLYDALNQYYVYFGGERYVDLGLGTHRVKCRVHKEFRLIVVAEKDIVYNKFPIPLINRLEKHFLTISNMLTPFQLGLADRLTEWAEDFAKAHVQTYQVHTRGKRQKYTVGDVFMGYHADTCASIILHVSSKFIHGKYEQHEEEIFDSAKRMLLWCATPDSLLRLQSTKLSSSNKELNEIYYKEQKHDSLLAYLKLKLRSENSSSLFAQVTTHSKLLSTSDKGELSYFLSVSDITLLTLQSFDTEQQFCRQIRNHLEHHREGESILIVQCDCGDQNSGLVACARYCIQDEINQQGEQLLGRIHVVFVIQLPRIAGGCFNGFQCGLWHSVHIDELRPPDSQMPTLEDMRRETVGALLDAAPYNISHSQEGENIDVEMSEETQDTEMTEEKLPVGVDDVVLIDEHPRAGQVPIVRKFNIGRLIFTCIHAALAKVKDTDRESARNTDRVKILLNLLHQKTTSGDKTFLSGLTSHLASLMKEKEEKLSAHSSTHWLEALATKADDISRAGTFRKTLDQCLADKVTPLLAGIIAYLDTNKNLDILASSDVESWKRKLWLQVINTTAATQIQYSMLMSPNQLQELQEFMVRGTKHDGHTFSALMPFSWLIFGLIEGILKTSREMDGFGDGLSKVKRASEIIRELPLGMLLTGTQGNIQEMVMAYISDFVYMVYPVTSTQEHQLVCENLHHGTRAVLGQEIDGVISLYVGIHVAYHTASPRLTNYSYIQSVWPDCSTAIIETQQKNPHYFLISEDEFTLDVMGLDLMLKNLVPSKEGLNTVQGRSSWVRLVHKYRPVVERILGYFTEKAQDDESNIGPKCLQGVENIRKQWTRVIVMKLFIEHVCTTDEHSLTVKRCMPFWIMLKEDVDLKNLKSVETVEKFLKLCNKDAVSQFFGKQENCRACESVIEERPVTLPCGHVVCLKCFNDTKIILKTYECPVCSEKFPEDFETSDEDKDRAKLDQYNDYRKRCNSFFMEVVSQLCFAHGTPPSVDVIKKLLNYITRQPRKGEGRRVTKELSVFDDGLDPNPVFRSFLLQLMIRTSTEDVTEHLESYFEEAQDMIKEGDDNDSHLVDLSLLVIQCLEDSYHNEAAKMEKPGSAEIKMATNLLTHNTNRLMVEELSVNKLYCLAEIRYGLTIAAKYLHENLVITKKTQKKKLDPHVRRLLDAAGKLCEECGSKWPKVFFVKYICRYYGTEVYQEIHKMKEASITRWVTIPELHQNKVVECYDRYIVCGDTYKTIREKFTHAALNSDAGKLQKALQASNRQQNGQTQIVTILALYREVTLSNLYPEQQRRFPKQAMDVIKQCLTEHDLFKSQTQFVGVLCDNILWRHVPYLNIAEGMDLRVQNTICLIIHVLVTLIYLPGETTLIEPLRRIATQPQRMKNAMLPTMPQDDVAEIKEALLAARGQNGGDNNPMFYRCPNGHPYVIGDCGRPYYEGKCKECGAQIGGRHHEAFPGNVKVEQWLDQTQTGHILGRADHRKTQAIPERKMTSAHCAVLRLLTHVAMFLGANENPQAILEMIKPDIDPPSVYNFLWSHIEVDITTLRNLLGKSTDDVILLLHHICQQILENHGHGERKNEEMCGLMNKEERGKWEDKFCKKFLAKPLQEFEKKLKDLNKAVLDDQRLGSDPLLCLLFETDSPAETIPNTCLHGNPAVWRYRAKISMEHLSNAFKTQMSFKQPVLRIFLEEEHHLRAIRMVPSIIKLQKFLVQRYQRKLAKAEATTLTIAEMVEQLDSGEGQVDDVEMLIHDFTEAWDSVRENLLKFTLPTSLGIATVPKEYCRRPIDYSSSVSQLLPSQKEAGLCSYGLLYFLLKKQNSFLEKYCKLKKIIEKNVHRVQLSELTAAHLISYHPEHDILPMVLANCNYSFEVGQGTKIEYNFRDFERQLTDRFLFSKSFVDIPVQQFEMMTYRSESTNAVVFERLREKIGQEPLSAAVRHQICEEFRSYTDLCDCLDRLDITISFLKSVGCGEDVKIEYFMTQTLKMENPIPSQKARQSSLCRHVQSLWLTLAMQKTKNQASYKHDTFEGVGDELREDLTEEQREVVRGFCEELQLEKLEVLLETLWECIMLRISVPQNPDDEDYIDTTKFSLRDVMIGYMDNPGYSTELDFPDWLKELTWSNRMPESDSPNTILASQAVDSWLFLYSLYGQKSQERRY